MSDTDLVKQVKEVIADGCHCDRGCESLVGPDVYCGCEVDAKAVIALCEDFRRPKRDRKEYMRGYMREYRANKNNNIAK